MDTSASNLEAVKEACVDAYCLDELGADAEAVLLQKLTKALPVNEIDRGCSGLVLHPVQRV
jgi:hypothetical protein